MLCSKRFSSNISSRGEVEMPWINTKKTKPSWRGPSIWKKNGSSIVWDGTSKYYATQTDDPKKWVICSSKGVCPNPAIDKSLRVEAMESHYIGIALLAARHAHQWGELEYKERLMDDRK